MSERLLTILEAASEFNVTTGLLYAAVAHGDLAAIRFRARGRIRLREQDVRAWIERHTSAPPGPIEESRDVQIQSVAAPSIVRFLPSPEFRRFS